MKGETRADERLTGGDSGHGQPERETRACPRDTRHVDSALVRLHDRLDHAQAQSKATLRAAVISTIQALPDVGKVLRGDAYASICHRDDDLVLFLRRAEVDLSPG